LSKSLVSALNETLLKNESKMMLLCITYNSIIASF